MAHYAFLDDSSIVTHVIVGKEENENGIDWEQFYATEVGQPCKRTSYNTCANTHRLGGTPFRKNYAGIGYTFDADRDAFIPPKPYDSWVLDENTCTWVAPKPQPDDGQRYHWDESSLSWLLLP